ncbi:3-ketoacyl-CoA synthase 6-like [Nicotiana tabacum]|uniref:3-ketoacyl-CoA synthase n=2 Tax=Nicotiana TaxID=4085 RepID=A0A1S3ZAF6_TOBAC|nr:PREDICTED: 3-ketoacyl-CoA synthase 5-like [Nicotiana sylvestris]XP_016461401.1 PREDICTED: 3-ketoacyl-CoA synthase 5-like [Nicotiana tabacum]
MELPKLLSLLIFFTIESLLILLKPELNTFHVVVVTCYFFFFIFKSRPLPVYLVDYSCLKPPNSCRVPRAAFIEHAQMMDFLDKESINFMSKVLSHSGQSEETYLPPAIHYIPPKSDHQEAINEVHMSLFTVFEDLLAKTNLSPLDIDVLIVNCSGFCPAPSLSSIIVNKFSMREDIKSYTISGMGCSASALAIDMAQNILKTHKNFNAVILSTEILSTGWYPGKEPTMLVLNCLFRMGAGAILISNKKEGKKTAKYKLLNTLRSQRSFDDKAYFSAYREEDSNGFTGVTLKRDLLQAAGETLRTNITNLGSQMLPYTEKIWFGVSVLRKMFVDKSTEIYVPNFKSVIQHFCLPTSGKPVIKEMGKGLKLGESDMEPALMTLHRFGNQSSSSLWYELAYIEAKEKVKKGDKIWLLGMGTGTKCTSLIWECNRPIYGEAQKGPWAETIDKYPLTM